jgi:hypothetical protein
LATKIAAIGEGLARSEATKQSAIDALDDFVTQRLTRGLMRRFNNLRIADTARRVAKLASEPSGQPVAFFKASTGIDDLSWNSGFHLLASWGLRLQGVPVVYFACNAGMSRCVLGTRPKNVHKEPPCKSCVQQSRALYAGLPASILSEPGVPASGSRVDWFGFDRDATLEAALGNLSLDELIHFTWPPEAGSANGRALATPQSPKGGLSGHPGPPTPLPLGELCLPGLRWILRRHNLDDDESTRFLLREYILSAWNVAHKFSVFLDATNPRAVVVFNGQFFPEATARHVAQARGLRVITHEVGLMPASAFFTDREATAYPIHIPDDFEMSAEQNARLDAYLEQRFQGNFSMAGIQFWPSMRGLDEAFLSRAAEFKQIVPVFTNVIFDTSQPHANTVFADMFAWLDMVLGAIQRHPETLFVIRAHPDETRARKESRETVQGWVEASGVDKLANAVFVAPRQYVSSYELIQRSKFVLVYNSTIGLEAAIMGKPVLCGGRARYTQYPTVFFPQSVDVQKSKMEELLQAASTGVPAEFERNARRFLYYQVFKTSLPFGDYLMPSVRTTQTRLKAFGLDSLSPKTSPAIRVITKGVLKSGDFLLEG